MTQSADNKKTQSDAEQVTSPAKQPSLESSDSQETHPSRPAEKDVWKMTLQELISHTNGVRIPIPTSGNSDPLPKGVIDTLKTKILAELRPPRNKSDSEDLEQACLAKIISGLPTYHPQRPFLPWARKVARNRAIDTVRTVKRRKTVSLRDDAIPSSEDPSFTKIDLLDTVDHVLADSKKMDDIDAEVFRLVCIEGLTQQKAAERLGISKATVSRRLEGLRARITEIWNK